MEEPHNSENVANELQNTLSDWEITEKIVAMVTGNARNMINVIFLMGEKTETQSVTCAAHSLRLTINKAVVGKNMEYLICLCSKVVGHFKYSSVAKQTLDKRRYYNAVLPDLHRAKKNRITNN